MKKAIRLMLPCALLSCTVGAHAQTLFTFNIPVDVHDIPAAFTSIKIGCILTGVSSVTFKPEGAADIPFSIIPLVEGKVKRTVSFTIDKKDLLPNYQANPALATVVECNFSFLIPGNNSTSYVPGYALAAFKPGTPLNYRSSVNLAALRGKN